MCTIEISFGNTLFIEPFDKVCCSKGWYYHMFPVNLENKNAMAIMTCFLDV